MSPQRVSEVASVCVRMVPSMSVQRAIEIAHIVGRGYFKVIQESEEWKECTGLCTVHSLNSLVKNILGKDASRILEPLTEAERAEFGFLAAIKREEPCFVWAWRSFCLFGRQFHHSSVTPKELVSA
jgi:hypothetical protein